MNRLLASSILLLGLAGCQRPSVSQYVRAHAQEISTVDPAATNDSDLEAIGRAIGDARIVLLGEQDHGDAPTFLAKTRIIRYLHERKGFNVLAFESDFFALTEGWDRLEKSDARIRDFLHDNIFSLWTDCTECAPLFYEYLPATYATGTPLQVAGFDCQPHGAYSSTRLRPYVEACLDRQNVRLDPSARTAFLASLDSLYRRTVAQLRNHETGMQLQEQPVDTILAQLANQPGGDQGRLVLENLKAYLLEVRHFNEQYRSWQYRDAQMARNLAWLVRTKYPNEKLVVWAANFHILKNGAESSAQEPFQWTTMGEYLSRDSSLGNRCYALGFTSRSGTAGRLTEAPYTVAEPPAESFERWIDDRMRYAFVDFRAAGAEMRRNSSFSLKGIGPNYAAAWMNMFDGIFYIRDMYRCTARR